MCGICGVQAVRIEDAVLARMNARLEPRGPDEAGTIRHDGVAIAMRRLCIIDPQGGSQPITNEDRTIWLVQNGEIYNFRELRAELQSRGHRFTSDTDTEVVVHGYEEWGPGVVERLNGMFAFALWDSRTHTWHLARDPYGQKPLYYVHRPGLFAFGSEPKALLEHPDVRRRLDPAGLASYLVYEYVPSPASLFEGIRKVPPGHRLTVHGDTAQLERWWRPPTHAEALGELPDPPARPADWAAELRRRLGDAVERHLISDVPLGCFLSGGLDSSAVAVLMAERSPRRIATFSIGFTEPSFDESHHAETVARLLGTDHHCQMVDAASLLELLPRVAEFMDEPLGDGSVLPTYALARFARSHVTVALSGDGGDELLGGYPTFYADRVASMYRRAVPQPVHHLLERLAGRLPVSHNDMSPDFKVRQFLRGASLPQDTRHFAWVGSFLPHELAKLLQPDVAAAALAESPYAQVARELAAGPERRGLERLLFLYGRFYLSDDLLVKVDRTTMACGLESRAPFLDAEFARFAAALPPELKVRGSRTKIALRMAFGDVLPPSIVRRPKKGFGMPVGRWLRGPLRPLLEELLAPGRLAAQGIFSPEPVAAMVRAHLDGSRDYRKQLWTLIAFQLWHDRHLAP